MYLAETLQESADGKVWVLKNNESGLVKILPSADRAADPIWEVHVDGYDRQASRIYVVAGGRRVVHIRARVESAAESVISILDQDGQERFVEAFMFVDDDMPESAIEWLGAVDTIEADRLVLRDTNGRAYEVSLGTGTVARLSSDYRPPRPPPCCPNRREWSGLGAVVPPVICVFEAPVLLHANPPDALTSPGKIRGSSIRFSAFGSAFELKLRAVEGNPLSGMGRYWPDGVHPSFPDGSAQHYRGIASRRDLSAESNPLRAELQLRDDTLTGTIEAADTSYRLVSLNALLESAGPNELLVYRMSDLGKAPCEPRRP